MNSSRFGFRHTAMGRPAGRIDARVAFGVDAKRHRLAAAEESAGVLRLGERQLIVKGHAAGRPSAHKRSSASSAITSGVPALRSVSRSRSSSRT